MQGNVHPKHRMEIKKGRFGARRFDHPQILIEDGECFKGSIEIERRAEREADNARSVTV
jgi:hypothetical protein